MTASPTPGTQLSAHIMLAFLNVLGAATLGVLIGFDKVYHFLPGFVLANVFAHTHLAALGWASMMVVGWPTGCCRWSCRRPCRKGGASGSARCSWRQA